MLPLPLIPDAPVGTAPQRLQAAALPTRSAGCAALGPARTPSRPLLLNPHECVPQMPPDLFLLVGLAMGLISLVGGSVGERDGGLTCRLERGAGLGRRVATAAPVPPRRASA